MYKVVWNGSIKIIDTSVNHWAGPDTIAYGYVDFDRELELKSITRPIYEKATAYLSVFDILCIASFMFRRPLERLVSFVSCRDAQKSESWVIKNDLSGYTIENEGNWAGYAIGIDGEVRYDSSLYRTRRVVVETDKNHPHYIAIAKAMKLVGVKP